jgi:hypothetical protein
MISERGRDPLRPDTALCSRRTPQTARTAAATPTGKRSQSRKALTLEAPEGAPDWERASVGTALRSI